VEIYREQLELELPFKKHETNSSSLILEVTYQGCADLGICYMPITKQIELDLAD
jgi:thiol:disulfide interchange protein DsbD